MEFTVVKSLHIIFVVTWFAGLFYIPRIFIYQAEAQDRDEPGRSILTSEYKRNAKRLWLGITWPSAILTLIFGPWMLWINPSYLQMPYMHVKLAMVGLLYIYHFYNHRIYRQQQRDHYSMGSTALRMWNEVATLFLVAIVFVIVLRDAMNWIYGVLGMFGLIAVLIAAIRLYKTIREKGKKG